MIIVSEELVNIDWTDIALSESRSGDIARRILSQSPRSPGVHLSGIARYIALAQGVLKPFNRNDADSTRDIRNGKVDEETMPLRMMLGMAYERFVAGLYPDMEWQPGGVIAGWNYRVDGRVHGRELRDRGGGV